MDEWVNSRQMPRVQTHISCVWGVTEDTPRSGTVTSLSCQGCFVETKAAVIKQGQQLFIKLWLPSFEWCTLVGKVLYHTEGVGYGLKFFDLSDQDRMQLDGLVTDPPQEEVAVRKVTAERRAAKRVRAYLDTWWERERGERHEGIVRDISKHGCFLMTAEPVTAGEAIVVEVSLPGVAHLCLRGWVLRAQAGVGCAVVFKLPTTAEQMVLQQLVRRLLQRLAG